MLKGRTLLDEEEINKYNKEVTQNWKLLTRGKLEISPDYEKHLRSGLKTLSISAGLKNLAEQEILLELEKRVSALPKPAIPGEFASIIIDYNNKLAADKEMEKADTKEMEAGQVLELHSMFSDNTIPGTPVPNEIGPYKDTALLATKIDLRKEKRMDMEKFRDTFLKAEQKKLKDNSDTDPGPLRVKYLKWVEREERKTKFAAKKVKKIESKEVKEIEESSQSDPLLKEPTTIRRFKSQETKPVNSNFVLDEKRGYQNFHATSDPDFIKIPKDVKYKYKTFQCGDTVYDREGQFLYRLPGKLELNHALDRIIEP